MKNRVLYIIDPLPNIAPLVRQNMLSLNDNKLSVEIFNELSSVDAAIKELNRRVKNGEDVALLAPFNETSNAMLLNQYKLENKNTVNSADLLDHILEKFYQINPHYKLPVIVPFVSIYKPEKIKTLLSTGKSMKYIVACMTKHILGVLDGTLNKDDVNKIFHRHFVQPILGVNLMKELV
jgi:hypothetical protein